MRLDNSVRLSKESMVAINLLFLMHLQGPDALHKELFFRGAAENSRFFARFAEIPNPWDQKTKELFVLRLFEASKAMDQLDARKKHHPIMLSPYITETDESYAKLAKNFPILLKEKPNLEQSQVWILAPKLRAIYPKLYSGARPFFQTATYRKVYPSPVHFLGNHLREHKRWTRSWLASELKAGATWEAKYPDLDLRCSRGSEVVREYQRLFPNAHPKADILGFSATALSVAIEYK